MKTQFTRRSFLSQAGIIGLGSTALPTTFPLQSKQHSLQKSDVKITDIKTYIIPRGLFVKLETDAGVTGWGECSPNNQRVVQAFIETDFKNTVIGRDPFDVEPIWDDLFWENHDLGPAGALPYAIAGIDLALWDIKGKILDVPVYKLLGGAYRKTFDVYGGFGLEGGKVPVADAVKRAVSLAEEGFKIIKFRMQIRENNLDPNPDPTLKYYKATRKELPDDVELFIDPNEGYTAARAILIGKALQDEGMRYYESPCPLENHRDTAQVVEALDIPVLAGEKCYSRWQFRDLITQGNPDVIQPDIIKSGGITEVKKIAALGQIFFKKVAPHNTKPTLGTAAALHLAASISNFGPFIEFVERNRYQEVLSTVENPIALENGQLVLPEGPGLGLTVDEKRVEQLAE